MDTNKKEYIVQREILDDVRLDEVAQKGTWIIKPTFDQRLKEYFRCSVSRLKLVLLSFLPVLEWLPQYPFREYILGDLVSGISTAILHLTLGLAYAPLAGLRPANALYTSFYPVLLYVIFGTCKHLSVGTFAVTSVMVGEVVQVMAPDNNFLVNGTNGTTVNTDARDAYRTEIAMALTIIMGIYQILLGLLKIGFMVNYMSDPMIRGYTTATAILVCISQLKSMFGVSPAPYSGILAPVRTFINICQLLPKTKPVEVIVTVLSLAVLIPIKEINVYFKNKLVVPIPIELIVVVFSTIIVHYGGLISKFGVSVVGGIPSGFQAPFAPYSNLYAEIAGSAIAVAIVSYILNISLAKTFSRKYGYKVDNNQELIAVGIGNLFGGFFQCYSVTASLSRSLVQESTGGNTQVAGIISSILMLIAILKLGSLFQDLPKALLAAIVVVNLRGMFLQFVDIPVLWRTNKVDLMVWIVTFIGAIVLNMDVGLALAVGFSMLTVIFRTQLPHYSLLGHVPGTDLYLDTETYREAKEIPGVKIFRSSTTVYYTNAEMYLDALQEKSGIDIRVLLTAKRKREADLKRQQENEKKKAKKEAKKQKRLGGHPPSGPFSLEETNDDYYERMKRQSQGTISEISLPETSPPNNDIGQVNWAYQHDPNLLDLVPDKFRQGPDTITQVSPPIADGKGGTHSIILDVSTLSFVDTVTLNTFKNIFTEFGEVDLDVYLAGCQACVVKQLETAGFFSDAIPKSKVFVTIHDAVIFVLKKRSQMDLILDISGNTRM
ncbi:solute carrier family 26 member 6-like [Channa argus]|uniref:solute carrier family 26 member 6-like n=1 Tax=Channa argus TaxID=215402 RepID=UPI0035222DBC